MQILLTVIVVYIIIIATIQVIAPNRIIGPEEFPEACPEKSKNCTLIGPNPHRGEGISEIRFECYISNVKYEV